MIKYKLINKDFFSFLSGETITNAECLTLRLYIFETILKNKWKKKYRTRKQNISNIEIINVHDPKQLAPASYTSLLDPKFELVISNIKIWN